jgi:hypothetical protein
MSESHITRKKGVCYYNDTLFMKCVGLGYIYRIIFQIDINIKEVIYEIPFGILRMFSTVQ